MLNFRCSGIELQLGGRNWFGMWAEGRESREWDVACALSSGVCLQLRVCERSPSCAACTGGGAAAARGGCDCGSRDPEGDRRRGPTAVRD